MRGMDRLDIPPHKVKVVWIDPKRAPHIYENVDHFYPNRLIWIIQFMNGSHTAVRFDLVLCIETLEKTFGEARQKEINKTYMTKGLPSDND